MSADVAKMDDGRKYIANRQQKVEESKHESGKSRPVTKKKNKRKIREKIKMMRV